jgi:hypothetical protein
MKYSKFSPYYETPNDASGKYMGQLVSRNVPASVNDLTYEISSKYNQRPDLLAYDLYGKSELWWVFAERNPNTLIDPVGDFRSGVIISIPDKKTLFSSIGI